VNVTAKTFYIRDAGTEIPAVALRFDAADRAQLCVLHHAGYGEKPEGYVALFKLVNAGSADTDPFKAHPDRSTMFLAHEWVRRHFDVVADGMHLDVEPFRLAAQAGDYSWMDLAEPPTKWPHRGTV
jgi:hypothetical protein